MTTGSRLGASLLLLALAPGPARAAIHKAVPAAPDAEATWVIYLHGAIVEQEGRRPRHPQHGIYELDRILESFSRPGVEVVAPIRSAGSDPASAAGDVVDEVRRLLDAGVPGTRISVVGFSKGAAITLLASSRLAEPDVRWIILAGCFPALTASPGLQLHGRVLSIHEASDATAPSCRPLAAASTDLTTFREVEISTGRGHGAFYRPRSEWIEPALAWAGLWGR